MLRGQARRRMPLAAKSANSEAGLMGQEMSKEKQEWWGAAERKRAKSKREIKSWPDGHDLQCQSK